MTEEVSASQAVADGTDPHELRSGLLATYGPLLRGRRSYVAGMGLSSFVAGVIEASLLVIIANIALTIGAQRPDDATMAASLGPLGALDMSVRVGFAVASILALVRAAFALVSAAIAARLTALLTAEIRAGTFADFAAASWEEQARRDEAEVQDLLKRHVAKATASVATISQGIGAVCTVIALLASAFMVNVTAAALLIVAGGLLFAGIRPLSRWAKTLSRAQITAGREYARMSLEAIGTSLEMRSFGVTRPVTERLEAATEAEVVPIRRAMLLKQLVTTAYQTATVFILIGGLLAVHTVVNQPLASLGAIIVILVRSLNQAAGLQTYYHQLVEAEPYIRYITDQRAILRSSAPRPGTAEVDGALGLRCVAVDYAYEGAKLALKEVTFEVCPGEAVGIIGPSGSGKSTLIQILLRLRQPTSGTYEVGGVDAAEVSDDHWFDQVAFVPQDSRLINDTIEANIAFYRPGVTHEEVVAAAKRAHIHEEIIAMPDGYATEMGSRGGAVSGGQRQRICIARALLRRPSVLVLDEPTSALDLRSEALVHETFTQLKGSVTIFAIAHRLSTLNSCDRIMVMGDGKLQAFGTRQELEQGNRFYQDALRLSQIRSDELSSDSVSMEGSSSTERLAPRATAR